MLDNLGDRMKEFYEDRAKTYLPRRTHVIIRVDGKAFHTYTKGLKRPFDKDLQADMDETARYMCENIQGAKMGYVQSDEISIVLTDFDSLTTDAWYSYSVQKMCSVAAALATAKFNQLRLIRNCDNADGDLRENMLTDYEIAKQTLALFDARVFSIPEAEEVANYFVWRQKDAIRNSVSMAAQSMFSHKDLEGVSSVQKKEWLKEHKSIDWESYQTGFKRGRAIVREKIEMLATGKGKPIPYDGVTELQPGQLIISRSLWVVDTEMPEITQNRNYILDRIKIPTNLLEPEQLVTHE